MVHFTVLIYCRDRPLYLERAPSNILSSSSALKIEARKDALGEKDVKRVLIEQCIEGVSEKDIDPDRVEVSTVAFLYIFAVFLPFISC